MFFLLVRPLVCLGLRVFFRLVGGVCVDGLENIPRRGRIIVAPNHLSHADPPLVGAYLPRAAWFAATDELFDYRLLGRFSRFARAVPIRQDSPDRAALRRLENLLKHEEALVLFPEGHESLTGELQPLQGGTIYLAMRTGSPVLPIGIAGTQHILPPRTFRIRRAAQPVCVRIGKPIPIDRLTGGRTGRAGINHGLRVLGEAIRELSGQEWAETGPVAVAGGERAKR